MPRIQGFNAVEIGRKTDRIGAVIINCEAAESIAPMPFTRFSLVFLGLFPCMALAAVPSVQEASQLFRQGQHASALEKVNAFLTSNQKDAQGRFLKGLILTELNRYQEAIKIFTELTDDYPELPEPYNNLAVLYATQGQYDRAKQSLEMAIRTHPTYATAHENLGDIYAKMASLAYDKALQLDRSNVSAQTKLAMVKDLFGPPRAIEDSKTKTAKAEKPAAKPVAVAKAALAEEKAGKAAESPAAAPTPSPTAKPAPTPAAMPTAQPTPAAQPTQVAKAAPAAATKPAPASAKPAKAMTAEEKKLAVEEALQGWAEAWSQQDASGYLSFYGTNFAVPGGDRDAWEELRRDRVTKPEFIKVEISKMRVDLDGNQAKAKFSERYESSTLKGTYKKYLVLELEDGAWKIVSEK